MSILPVVLLCGASLAAGFFAGLRSGRKSESRKRRERQARRLSSEQRPVVF